MFLLCCCLAADITLVWYFRFHEPCTSSALNSMAYRAFGFSACVNIAAMFVLYRGEDYGPSVFLFVYVGWMICTSRQPVGPIHLALAH